jgi:single-stranded DNA-binding protein
MTPAPSPPATAPTASSCAWPWTCPPAAAARASPSGEGITRWIKVTAFGLRATRTGESVRKGDRVTVVADDLIAEAWAATGTGEPRARVTLRAREIAASMAFDTLRTGFADRKAARLAAANGEPSDPPAGEQAELRVLRGVTTTS